MRVLGIETSCDETAAAVVEDGRRARSDVVATQIDVHRKWGGVVPELASRNHVMKVLPVVDEALEKAGVAPAELDAIAVTSGPGLVGALLVGVQVAKALAAAWEKPLVRVNHLEGHLVAAFLSEGHHQPVRLGRPGGRPGEGDRRRLVGEAERRAVLRPDEQVARRLL